MGTIQCPNCGLKVSDADSECFACGYPLPKNAQKPVEQNIDIDTDDYYSDIYASHKEPPKDMNISTDIPTNNAYSQERDRLQALYDFQREKEEAEQKKKEELAKAEHQKKLDSIPIPKPYGDFTIYKKLGGALLIFLLTALLAQSLSAAFIFILSALAVMGLYGSYSYFVVYKRIESNVDEYKEQQLAIIEDLQNTKIRCPKCKSENVTNQVFQENKGSRTTSTTNFKIKEKGHGIFWWLCIGWWWWMIDIMLWVLLFLPRLILAMFYKKKKYVGKSRTKSRIINDIRYKTIHLCQNCGHTW